VPRPGIDEAYYTRLMQQREVPNKPLANQPREEASSVPPPLLKRSPQAERPPQPRRIVVQVREGVDYEDVGEVLEGYYDIKGSVLYVWNARDNSPIGQVAISPGDDVEFAARRLLREKAGKNSFHRPINYRRSYH